MNCLKMGIFEFLVSGRGYFGLKIEVVLGFRFGLESSVFWRIFAF